MALVSFPLALQAQPALYKIEKHFILNDTFDMLLRVKIVNHSFNIQIAKLVCLVLFIRTIVYCFMWSVQQTAVVNYDTLLSITESLFLLH